MKIFPTAQIPLIERPHSEPIYFAHIYLAGETLYFSDRNFKFNGHDYEAYLLNIPETVHSIERFGGYLNIDAQLTFRNAQFRSYPRLFDFFLANPITWREVDLFVLYLDNGQVPETDDSTKLHKVSIGEFKRIQTETFEVELFSILFALDQKKLFTQISRENWPQAAPCDIGKFENRCIGSIRDVPCHCIETGAVTTLAVDAVAGADTIYLTEVDYPIPFPNSGIIQIGISYIAYTGKNSANKTLTGCSWYIPARNQKRGEPIWEIRSTYKYLVDTSVVKSVSNVKAAGIKVADADRTVTLNEGGKTTITFTQRTLLKNQGAHLHGGLITERFLPNSAGFNYDAGMAASGVEANLRDGNQGTLCHIGLTGVTDGPKNAWFVVGFQAYGGVVPDRVYACVVCDSNLGFMEGEYFKIYTPQSIPIGVQGWAQGKSTFRVLLSGTSVPGSLGCIAHTDQGTSAYPCLLIVNVYEMWLELEFDNIPSGGESAIWSALAPLVTCDVEGYKDDALGTYTTAPNSLIQIPTDVLIYLLVGIMGRSMSEIDASFGVVRGLMFNRHVIGGYKISGILSRIGTKLSDIVRTINEQSRSQLREDGGKWLLSFHESPIINFGMSDILPPDGFGVTASGEYGGHVAAHSCDNNGGTYWQASDLFQIAWILVDWGIKKIINALSITPLYYIAGRVKDFTLWGSNDGVGFIPIYSGTHGNSGNKESYLITLLKAYRYHLLKVTSTYGSNHAVAICEWELFELTWLTSYPSSAMTIDKTIFVGDPVFNFTPANEIRNLIRAVYDLDYGNNGDRRKYGDYFGQTEIGDDGSIGSLGELSEETAYPWIRDPYMTLDVAMWRLTQRKYSVPMVRLVCKKQVKKLERDDHFTLNDCPVAAWEGALWRVLEVREIPNLQEFEISAIKYIAS